MDTPEQFWIWFRTYVQGCCNEKKNPFLIIHPEAPRKKLCELMGWKYSESFTKICAWTEANKKKVCAEINAVAKPLGFKLKRGKSSYTSLEKIS